MIERIIEVSARNRAVVFMLVTACAVAGWFSLQNITIDAIPDLSDTQVIIYSKWDRSPDVVEDQVTYPIISALLGAPKVKDIRGFSDFGFSYVYVIFEDGTDPYWARSRTLEYLSKISSQLPADAKTELGPDATGVGWVYQYALVDKSGEHSLTELRSLQDWFLRFHLQSVPGVAEVAAIGGFQKQYQVQINPSALLAYNISIQKVVQAVKDANNDVGARLIEIAGAEYMIRGKGYVKSLADIENIMLTSDKGTPVYLKNIAKVTLGPEIRRGVSDLDGLGDTVSGIIIMRYGENAPRVIDAVKARLEELKPSLPKGVEIIPTYDRSDLIHRAVDTLKHELLLELLIVSLVILLFLLSLRGALIPIVTLPLAVLLSFIPMYLFGLSSNIMSLGGIAIAIGAMVDAAIVVVENVYKRLETQTTDRRRAVIDAIKQVGPASFYSLLVIAVSFLPIFALQAQEGRLFKPLAYTKNLSMLVAAILSITLVPALLVTFARGKSRSEENHFLSRVLIKLYGPIVRFVVRFRWLVIVIALLVMVVTIPVYLELGSEFMPPLNEGTLLYMPTTMPGISVAQAQDLLQRQDAVLKSFPEVEHVHGKAGRADTSTDSAPLSMMETVVWLKPQSEWRMGYDELVAQMDAKMQFAGTSNSWTMPIRNRIDMQTTGIRTPIGIKILGDNVREIESVGVAIEKLLRKDPHTRSVFAERVAGGYFVDVNFDREKLARYGISMSDAQETLMAAVGGETVTKTIERRERYSINVRYNRDFRSDVDALKHVLVAGPSGLSIPLGQIASIQMTQGPSMIRDENGLLASYVYIDIVGVDLGTYVDDAKKLVQSKIELPKGVALRWSGQYENLQRVRERLTLIIPITLLLIMLLIFANTRSWVKTAIVFVAVPFSAVGAVWLLYLLGYNLSIAVWVGIIALLGVDAETGIFMLLYLDLAYEDRRKSGNMNGFDDLREAIYHGAVKRLRPKLMTVMCLFAGLMPIMWASTASAGADVMKRIAAPMLGGIVVSFAMELLVYPAIFAIWKSRTMKVSRPTILDPDDRIEQRP
jgi:Cu(I)/Ag(I) efflux system membrane protein CusA/SilA